MLFTQFNMDDALEVRYEEGFEDGTEKGKMQMLIQIVCRKLQRGKSPELIAEELEQDVELICRICTAAQQCEAETGHGAHPDDVYELLEGKGE